jgi:tRNA threonylcarbamoyl adenosine modification protein (Sua5/YciO/YrdC/YwlC family)
MYCKINENNPSEKKIQQAVECIQKGGIVIYPTDTLYAIGCDLTCKKSLDRIASMKKVKLKDTHFSIIVYDLSQLSEYAKQVSTHTYKLLKRIMPGPYTVILKATNKIPKLFTKKKKTIGIRIPDNKIIRQIVKHLDNPIASTSINDEEVEYTTNAELMFEKHNQHVDMVIDGGIGMTLPSTVINCVDDNNYIIEREGRGSIDGIF